ncbi:hypothetical protein [Streptomyces albus]|uniref:hypothetical protein n=1 Tax=Streptomyces albus TaxID=1888 RepID=UPI0033D9F03E
MPESVSMPVVDRVGWIAEAEYWLVDDPELSKAVLADDRFSSSTLGPSFSRFVSPQVRRECAHLLDVLGRWFVDHDPPEHTQERRRCQSHFSRGTLARLTPRIEHIVADVLDRIDARPDTVADAVTDIAQPVSARVISLALGLEAADAETLHRWSQDIGRFVGAVYRPDFARAAQGSLQEMAAMLQAHLAGGGTSAYEGSDPSESLAAHTMMLFGGLETSARLIGQVVWAVATGECGPKTPADDVIEAMLRRFPPVKYVARALSCDVSLAGHAMREGDLVMVSLAGSADELLAFGWGRHFCLGMPLTMLETRILLDEFRRRYPRAALVPGGARESDNPLYHGFGELLFRP